MTASAGPMLVVVPAVAVAFDGASAVIDDKLFEGLCRYCDEWNGSVAVLCHATADEQLYAQRRQRAALPFDLQVFDLADDRVRHTLATAAVVLAAADDHRQLTLARHTAAPIAYVIEYTLRTRLQQIMLGAAPLLSKLKATLWTVRNEARLRIALGAAAALQANGTPAFQAYRHLNADSLLYFDTRIDAALRIRADELDEKLARLPAAPTLRLAFSGRLEAIKGADHLVAVAQRLRRDRVDFKFDIFGTGSLIDRLRHDVVRLGLGDQVQIHGAVDFATTLVPALRSSIDLFVCCHRQDDPSCTYLETLACGVPIAGYPNRAFNGIVALGAGGAATRAATPAAMAELVRDLANDRARLGAMTRDAVRLGREHGFERVFAERVRHLTLVAQPSAQRDLT